MIREQTLDRTFLALVVLMSALPVLAVVALFPTPSIDLREQINWGANFPLYTWKHPPLQSWLAGLVALTSVRDAWPYVGLAQCLNLMGLFYIMRTAAEFIEENAAVPVGASFCGLVFFSLTVPDMALNADLIQVPLWLAVLFHTLRGARDDRWVDWLAVGALSALAILAKYFSILFLLSLGLAVVLVPQDRPVWRRPGPYVAALLGIAILAPHLLVMLANLDMLAYGAAKTLKVSAPLLDRLWWVGVMLATLAVYSSAPLIGLGDAAWRGKVRLRDGPRAGSRGIIVVTALVLLAVMIAFVVLVGFHFRTRFVVPMLSLVVLLVACYTQLAPEGSTRYTTFMLIQGGCGWGAALILALMFPTLYVREPPLPRLYLREPAPAAAAMIRSDWNRRFACGPAYIVGADADAHSIGLYFGAAPIGLSDEDVGSAHWVDRAHLRDLGVIVVAPSEEAVRRGSVPRPGGTTELTTLSLPPRRWPSFPARTYVYYFVPPQKCGADDSNLTRPGPMGSANANILH